MDKFEFFFSLLSLLLGLAMTQLAGGMASALKLRGRIHVGWLTPLAALVICLDIASFWPSLWALRESVEIRMHFILTGVALCLGYYMTAAFAFPDDMKASDDLDAWYFTSGRFALIGTLAMSISYFIVADVLLMGEYRERALGEVLWSLRGWFVYITLLLIAFASKDKRVCGGCLAFIILLYPLQPFIFA